MPKKCAKNGQNVMLRPCQRPFYVYSVTFCRNVIDLRQNIWRASKIKCQSDVFRPLFIARIAEGINFAPRNTDNVQRRI